MKGAKYGGDGDEEDAGVEAGERLRANARGRVNKWAGCSANRWTWAGVRARTTAAEAERFPIAMATRGKEDTCRSDW